MTQGNDCVHLAWGRDKQVTARTTVGGECHVICTLTRTVFDDGSIYDKLDGRQTIVCYYFSLRLLKVLVISVHIQSVLRWFIPPWQSHDKQTICQASRPYLVFASHAYRDKDCVTKVVWVREQRREGFTRHLPNWENRESEPHFVYFDSRVADTFGLRFLTKLPVGRG